MPETIQEERIYDEKHASAYYYPEEKTMKVVWNGNVSDELYKDVFESLLKAAEVKKTERFISNTLKQGVVSISARKYFEKEVTPRSIELGIRRTAVITDANVFKKYYLNFLIKASAKFGNPVKLLSTETEAWDFVLAE